MIKYKAVFVMKNSTLIKFELESDMPLDYVEVDARHIAKALDLDFLHLEDAPDEPATN